MRFHRPAHHAAAPSVDDDGEVQRASPCRDVGDIGHPEAVWSSSGEVTFYQVRRRPRRSSSDGGVGTLTTTYALQARTVHQASHALSSHLDAFVTQLGTLVAPDRVVMNTRRTICAPRTRVCGPDALGQPCILARPLRRTTFQPRVEAADGDPQQATCRRAPSVPDRCGDRIACPVRLHELEDPDGIESVSRANQAAAFARISRSRRSCLFSRRRRASSSRPCRARQGCRSAVVTAYRRTRQVCHRGVYRHPVPHSHVQTAS